MTNKITISTFELFKLFPDFVRGCRYCRGIVRQRLVWIEVSSEGGVLWFKWVQQ